MLVEWLIDVFHFPGTIYCLRFYLKYHYLVCICTWTQPGHQILDQKLPRLHFFAQGASRGDVGSPGGNCSQSGHQGTSVVSKFNEKSEVQGQFTPQYLFSMAGLPYSGEYYYSLESQIVSALRFRFKFTTPFDYLPIFAALFPWNTSFLTAITDILNLTIILPACASFSSEEIFYATIKTIF